MSNTKRPKPSPLDRQQIPSIRPQQTNKLSNQQRLRQVYKSTSTKQKEKSKPKNGRRFYLPIPDKKLLNDLDNEPKTTGRYQSYLQGEDIDKHYQQLSHRYHQSTNRGKNQRYAQNDPRSEWSSNLEPNSAFRRKMPHQKLGQIDTSLRKSSSKNIQNQLNQLNQNFHQRNSKKLNNLQNPDMTSRYRVSSNYEQNPYQNEMFKIRRSTKKSLSGSLSKKPSQNSIREESKIDNSLSKHIGTKSQLSSPKSDLLQQGKQYFKSGDYKSALERFEKGQEQEQKNLNYKYNITLIYLKQHNYEKGLQQLEQIISVDPQFKKTVYLFAVISSKHLDKIDKALQIANKGIQVYKNFTDLIFYRGKLYKQLHKVDQAIEDMQKVISLQKDHVQALYLLTFLYFEKELMTHAMSALSSAIYYDQDKNSEWRAQAFKLRAKLYLTEGKIKEAKKDIIKLKMERQAKSSMTEIYYLQGKLQILENSVSDALINFEKCLREQQPTLPSPQSTPFPLSTPGQFLIPSLLQICKTKINVKDFYSAYHHISRAKHFTSQFSENNDSLLRFRYFIEGVVFLMKRKIDEGMKGFERFVEVEGKLKEKIKSLKTMNLKNPYSPAKYLESKQLQTQIDYFYPSFYLYRAFGFFMQNKHQLAIKDYKQYEKSQPLDKYTLYNLFLAKGINQVNLQDFHLAIKYFNKAEQLFFKSETKKIEPYIYRAMTSIQMARICHKGEEVKVHRVIQKNKSISIDTKEQDKEIRVLELVFEALKQLDKAYDLNDSNSNLLFIRSLIYAYLNKHQQSLEDIIKAISKSQQNVPKYFFFRGLLHSTLSNTKQAFNDFNIAINLDNNNAAVYMERAKLYFQTENYSKALEDLAKYGELADKEDVEFHKAALYLINGLYPMAEETAQMVKDQQSVQFMEMKFHVCLKMGKIQQAEEFILQQAHTDKSLLRIIRGDYDSLPSLSQSQHTSNPPTSSLKFFSAIQYYHLVGIAYFNLQQYERALQEFTIALKECNLRDMERNTSTYSQNKKSSSNDDNDDENVNLGDKDMNCIVYNIFLCHMQMNNIKKAYEVFIKEIMPVNEKLQRSEFMVNFSHLLFQAMKRSSSPKKFPQTQGLSMNSSLNDDKEQAHVELFTNMFTDVFGSEILIETSTFVLRTKLCYLNISCERLKLQYSGKLWPQFVLSWLNVKEIQNRPEPPWVKRQQSDQGLVFTDEVQNINIEFQTTQHDQQEEDSEQEEQQQDEEGEQVDQENDEEAEYQDDNEDYSRENNQESSNDRKRFDPRKFKDQMKLDDSIQRKLNKIVNRSKD